MSLYNIYMDIRAHSAETAILIAVLLKLIDIAPIKINPWSGLLKAIQRFFVGELISKIDVLEKTQNAISDKFEKTQELMQSRFQIIDKQMNESFNTLREDRAFDTAMNSRYRLIRAADDLREGVNLSKEHLEILLQDDKRIYETYCNNHPDFINHKGRVSVQMLTTYEEMLLKKEAENNLLERKEQP